MNFNKKTILPIIAIAFLGCASTQTLEKEAPTDFGNVYFQRWNAGVKEGGSGLDIYIPVRDKSVVFDSVYFRGKATKLKYNQNAFVGHFKTEYKINDDIIMSDDSIEESKNTLKPSPKIPFELKDNECIVSYTKNKKTLCYKIENVEEKQVINYPSARPQKQ